MVAIATADISKSS